MHEHQSSRRPRLPGVCVAKSAFWPPKCEPQLHSLVSAGRTLPDVFNLAVCRRDPGARGHSRNGAAYTRKTGVAERNEGAAATGLQRRARANGRRHLFRGRPELAGTGRRRRHREVNVGNSSRERSERLTGNASTIRVNARLGHTNASTRSHERVDQCGEFTLPGFGLRAHDHDIQVFRHEPAIGDTLQVVSGERHDLVDAVGSAARCHAT